MIYGNIMMIGLIFTVLNTVSSNGSFEEGFANWNINAVPPIVTEIASVENRTVARVRVPADVKATYPGVWQEYEAAPNTLFSAHVDAMGQGVKNGHGVYMAVEFLSADGKRLSFAQSNAARPDGVWCTLSARTIAPPETVRARIVLLLNGHGEANFTNVKVDARPMESEALPGGPVTLTVTDKKICASFKGFGVEDDGWFYNRENADHGVGHDDWKIKEDRIRWMQPHWIRMFFWYKDWNPSGDWETFTFDSDNMQSHYLTLDLYQSVGAYVNAVGVEWGMPKFSAPDKTARAIGALFEHLSKNKGYTCIQEWTLTNEPNGSWERKGNTFEEYVRLHELVKQEFQRRGLSIRILGSDDTSGLPWFENCVGSDRYFDCANFFASHIYSPVGNRRLAPFFLDDRLELLRTRTPEQQLVIAEFGFQDHRSGTLMNPLMESYSYALWTSEFVIRALNKGIAGFSIWCLHEVYYPGNGFMNYGLWNFKDRNWGVRPVYTAWTQFTRHAKPGDAVYYCGSTAPEHVQAACLANTLFWVNHADKTMQVQIVGASSGKAHAYTESTLMGDQECGIPLEIQNGLWAFPAQSFGRMEVK